MIAQQDKEIRPIIFLPETLKEYTSGVNLYRHLQHTPSARPVLIIPPLGNTGVAIEHFAGRLGLLTLARFKREFGENKDSILPLPVTDQIKERGISDSPPDICFPFKIALGSIMEGLDEFERVRRQTSDNFYPLILTHRSSGFCRERCYGTLEELILRDSSSNPHKDFDFYAVHESLRGIWDLVSVLSDLSGKGRWRIIRTLNETIERLDMVEKFEDRVRYAQSSGADFSAVEEVLTKAKRKAAGTDLSNSKLKKEFEQDRKTVAKMIPVESKPKGVIAVTGEIFHCEELMNNSTLNLGKELLIRGFNFTKKVGLHHYTPRFRLTPDRFARWFWGQINPFKRDLTREEAAAGGLKHDSGGHSVDIVALVRRQSKTKEYDAILEIYPFGCTPSIVAASPVNKILRESGIPYLRLVMDEQTGEAGFITRIEAWLELIIRRKRCL